MAGLLFILILIGIVLLLRRHPIGWTGSGWMPQRAATYVLALAALLAVLFALASLSATLIGLATSQIGSTDARDRAALALAALIVGLPIGIALQAAIRRRLLRLSDERNAVERRLFLAAIFATTAVVALFAAQTVLQALLTLPAPTREHVPVMQSIDASTRLPIFGIAWWIFARLGRRERLPRTIEPMHDLAVFAVAIFAIGFFAVGLLGLVHQIMIHLVGESASAVEAPARSAWATWGEIASWLVAGSGFWAAFLRYDLARGGRRLLRVLYLYAVIVYAGTATVGFGTAGLFETPRRAFDYHPIDGDWVFLSDMVPAIVTAGLIWAGHWLILRHQAMLGSTSDSAAGGISWPRRPALAAMALVGTVMTTFGILAMIWVGIDAVCGSAPTHAGPYWWRDGLSAGIAAALVGIAVWVPAWLVLQRAARAAPAEERSSLERRLLLGTAAIAGALTSLGFTIAWLWLLLRTVLGSPHDATTLANALQYLITALIAILVAGYYGRIMRDDLRYKRTPVHRVRLTVFVAPGTEEMLAELRASTALRIDIAGYLPAGHAIAAADLSDLHEQLAMLGTDEHADRAILMLQADGSSLYPYTKQAPTA